MAVPTPPIGNVQADPVPEDEAVNRTTRLHQIRMTVAALSVASIAAGILLLGLQAPGDLEVDWFLIILFLVGSFPCIFFVNLVRTRRGTVVGGAILLAASIIPSVGLFLLGFDEGLEILNVPFFTWIGALTGVATDSFNRPPRDSRSEDP